MLRFDQARVRIGSFTLSADFGVARGSRVAVIGPSGAGKSTLLGMVSGFTPLTAGKVSWGGQDLGPLAPGARPVSILFQDQNLFPHLSVAQNIGLGIRPDLHLSADQRAAASHALTEVGLAGLENRLPAQLSGGQQSRVTLARALLRARPILLLDEAFSALGPALKTEMLELLTRIATENEATVLMVTHDPNDARAFAPETVLVMDGAAHGPMPTGPMLDNPPPGLAAYLG
ncbi:MAG: ATP-binding cassette domain-containing protein [Paracoccus sp. (in: a-proteobacteria)]